MQAQLNQSPIGGGINVNQSLQNWNWNMQVFQTPLLSGPGNQNELGFGSGNIPGNFFPENPDGNTKVGGLNAKGCEGVQGQIDMNNYNNPNFMNINPAMLANANASMAFSALQQQYPMMNKLNALNPTMFQNISTDSFTQAEAKAAELITSTASYHTKIGKDEGTINQYNLKKERLSPPHTPSWFPGLHQTVPSYSDSNNSSSNMMAESIAETNTAELSSLESSSQSNLTVPEFNSNDQKEGMLPPMPQPTPPYYANGLPNPLSGFWGGNFMYNNPSQFSPFFNQPQPFVGNSNPMNPGQMVGSPFRFPSPQFNPFMQSPGMPAFHNNFFHPNIQDQHALFQQQQHEQFLAFANQQQNPIIKQENEEHFEPHSPNSEEDKRLEDEHLPSSQTDEEGERNVKPRKSSKCQCPNCLNPQPDDENAKIIKKHACHWPGCVKTYGKTSHLKSHIRQHQGIRPFICPDQTCLKVRFLNLL